MNNFTKKNKNKYFKNHKYKNKIYKFNSKEF